MLFKGEPVPLRANKSTLILAALVVWITGILVVVVYVSRICTCSRTSKWMRRCYCMLLLLKPLTTAACMCAATATDVVRESGMRWMDCLRASPPRKFG